MNVHIGLLCITWIFGGSLVRFITGTSDAETLHNAALSLRRIFRFFLPGGAALLRSAMQAMGRKPRLFVSSCIELVMKSPVCMLLIPTLGFFGDMRHRASHLDYDDGIF